MKKKLLIITLFIITLLSIFCFTACGEDTVLLTGIKLDKGNSSEIVVGGFNYNDYKLVLSYSDGSSEIICFNETMIDSSELIQLYKVGDYSINVSYGGFCVKQEISVKTNTFSDDIVLKSKVVTYDGNAHYLEIEGPLPEGTSITYPKGNSFINANTYELSAVLASDTYVSKTIYGTLEIKQAVYEINDITFTDVSYIYDGQPKSISVVGDIPNDLTCTYYIGEEKTNESTNAGNYIVEAKLDAGPNYLKINSLYANLTIEKGNYDMSNYKMNNKIVTYNGQKHSIILTNEDNLPNGVVLSYENNNNINAGQYTVIAHFVGDLQNYNEIQDKKAILTIQKASISLTGVTLDSNKFTYDGKSHALLYEGKLPSGVSFVGYENNNMIDAGEYEVKANFIYQDTNNYNPIEPLKAKLVIEKAQVTGLEFNNETFEYNGSGQSIFVNNVPSGLEVIYSNNGQTEPGEYKVVAKFKSSDSFANNYYLPSDLEATLTISKKKINTGFVDQTVEYDGTLHTINALKDCSERSWITVKYYTIENNNKITFSGVREPGEYLIFAEYTCKDSYLENYSKYYDELDRESAILTISKMHYTPVLGNRTFDYDGTEKAVTIDTSKINMYNYLDFTVTYENNVQTEKGIYTGSASFTLTEESSKYYYPIDTIEFNYCIAGTEKEVYTPIINASSVVYDGKEHSIYAVNLLQGISVTYQGNNVVEPGNHVITAIFTFTDPILEYYYQFPESYQSFFGDSKYTQVQLQITKKIYNLSYDVGPFVYSGENNTIEALNVPDWIKIDFEYDKDERIVPGEYKVTCKPYITNEYQNKYYQVLNTEITFTVVKAVPTYTFSSLVQKYDGELKRVEIYGLPDGIIANVTGDLVSEVGSYNVEISFENNNPCYTNIVTQQVTLVIENNVVDISDFVVYSKAQGMKSVKQFTSVSDIFSSKFNTLGLDIEWSLTYYKDQNAPYPKTDIYRNASGYFKILNKTQYLKDFTFTEFTNDNEYCFFMYSIKTTNGYIFSDSSLGDEYSGSILLTIGKTQSIDISKLVDAEMQTIEVNQNDTLRGILSKYVDLSNVAITFEVNYYTPESVNYPTTLENSYSSSDATDFIFTRNTWFKEYDYNIYSIFTGSYVLVNFEIKANSGYCLQDDNYSSQDYSSVLQINVKASESVDLGLIGNINNTNVSIDQYTSIDKLFEKYVDIDSCNINYSIYDLENNLINSGTINNTSTVCYSFDNYSSYIVKYNITPNESLVFYGINTMNYQGEFNLNINNVEVINGVEDYIDNISNKISSSTIYQYTNLNDILSDIIPLENTYLSISLYQDNAFVLNTSNFDIRINNLSDNTQLCILVFTDNGYILQYNQQKSTIYSYTIDLNVMKRNLLDISDIIEYTSTTTSHTVQQYSKLSDEFILMSSFNNSEFTDNVNLIIKISIYNEQGFVKDEFEGNDYTFTTCLEDNEYYLVSFVLSIKENSNYILDQIYSNEITLNTKYVVNQRTAISYNDIENLQNFVVELNNYSSFIQSLDGLGIPEHINLSLYSISYMQIQGDEIDPNNDIVINKDLDEYNYVGSSLSDFIFQNPTNIDTYYYISLFYVVEDGYCIVTNENIGLLYTQIYLIYKINKIEFVELKNINDTISTIQTVRQFTNLTDYIHTLFVNSDLSHVDIEWNLTTKNVNLYENSYSSNNLSDVYFEFNTLSDEYFELYLVITAKEGYVILDEALSSHSIYYYNCNIEVSSIYTIDCSEFNDFWNNSENQIAATNNYARATLKDLIYLGNISDYVTLKTLSIYKDGELHVTYEDETDFLDNYEMYYLYNYNNTSYTFNFTFEAKDYCCFGVDNCKPITTLTIENVTKYVVNTVSCGISDLYNKSREDVITVKKNEVIFTATIPEGMQNICYISGEGADHDCTHLIDGLYFSYSTDGKIINILFNLSLDDNYISFDDTTFIAYKNIVTYVNVIVV